MESTVDTIYALATSAPSVEGSGIAIVRVSGPDAISIAGKVVKPGIDIASVPNRVFRLVDIEFDEVPIDTCGILIFRGPKSYSGEDTVEFHLHGGISIIRSLQKALRLSGARPAEPGEFTRRAFLNGRIDLVQAEAIASLVSARGNAAQREALRQRSGTLSERLTAIRKMLRDILAKLEVDFDYPEEAVDGIAGPEAVGQLDAILSELDPLLRSYDKGSILRGFRLAIIGLPNVGKSSLLNALLEENRAIVTSSPGTTRDVVSGTLSFGGVPAELLDTAGIRIISDSLDTAEAEGIRRSWHETERADLVLVVFDTSIPIVKENVEIVARVRQIAEDTGATVLLVSNKSDLFSAWEPSIIGALVEAPDMPHVVVSATRGEGIAELRAKVREIMDLEVQPDEILLTEARHRAIIREINTILSDVRKGIEAGLAQDVAATELWGADRAIGRLLGEGLAAVDLDEIFSRFCIGK